MYPKSQNLYLNMINKERKILTIEYEKMKNSKTYLEIGNIQASDF